MWLNYSTERGPKSIATRKTTTSTEVKNRWNAANYKRYTVSLRVDDDAEIIDYINSQSERKGLITQIFRLGYETIKKEGK